MLSLFLTTTFSLIYVGAIFRWSHYINYVRVNIYILSALTISFTPNPTNEYSHKSNFLIISSLFSYLVTQILVHDAKKSTLALQDRFQIFTCASLNSSIENIGCCHAMAYVVKQSVVYAVHFNYVIISCVVGLFHRKPRYWVNILPICMIQ